MVRHGKVCEDCIKSENRFCSGECYRFYYMHLSCYLQEKYCVNHNKKPPIFESPSGYSYCSKQCYELFQKNTHGFGDTLQYQLANKNTADAPIQDHIDNVLKCIQHLRLTNGCCEACNVKFNINEHRLWPVMVKNKKSLSFFCYSCYESKNHIIRDYCMFDKRKDKMELNQYVGIKNFDWNRAHHNEFCYINCAKHGRVRINRVPGVDCKYCGQGGNSKKFTKKCDNCPNKNYINPIQHHGLDFCSEKCNEEFKSVPFVDYLAYQVSSQNKAFGRKNWKKQTTCRHKVDVLLEKLNKQRQSPEEPPLCGKCNVELYETHFVVQGNGPNGYLHKGNITFNKKKNAFTCLKCDVTKTKSVLLPAKMFKHLTQTTSSTLV